MSPNPPRHETYEHGADMGVRGLAPDLAGAFVEVALAMMSIITDPAGIDPRDAVEIRCAATDDELLLVDWLNALVYEMATRRMLFGRFEVAIEGHKLTATAWGEPVDVRRHQPTVEIKGATYTTLKVERDAASNWMAQTVVDV
jgi:tRNA nucleotidyltransferase (CCA-adding enzyme)